MGRGRSQQLLFAALLALGVATVGQPPPGGGTVPLVPALVLGAGCGLGLFRALAGGWPGFPPARVRPARALRRAGTIAARAAVEEVAWRGYVLALLVPLLTPIGALAASSGLFSLAHGDAHGRRRLVHLLTGAIFGGLYLSTGRLGAPVVAHSVYNAAIALALACRARAGPRRSVAVPAVVRPVRRRASRPVGATQAPDVVPAEAVLVEKRFGRHVALAGVDLRLETGEVLALLGRNGAGKSTLVSLLLGLRRPDAGTVRLFGRDPRLPSARTGVGAALQEPAFPPTLRVSELVELVAAHFQAPLPATELLERFGLASLAPRHAGGLSGGQRRRLATALAFVGRPRAVFLDEPTAALDIESRRALWDAIRAHAAGGGSVLLSTHQLDEAEALAGRVAVIDRGSIVASGSVAELRRRTGISRVRVRARQLPPLDAALRVERTGEALTLQTRDLNALIAELARIGIGVDELEISPVSLEDALLELLDGGPA